MNSEGDFPLTRPFAAHPRMSVVQLVQCCNGQAKEYNVWTRFEKTEAYFERKHDSIVTLCKGDLEINSGH